MFRGTTPTHTFKTNINLTEARVFVTYVQDGRTILEKTGQDVSVTNNSVSVTLTQKETLAFKPSKRVNIQIRYVFQDGTAGASNVMNVEVSDVLKEGEIVP